MAILRRTAVVSLIVLGAALVIALVIALVVGLVLAFQPAEADPLEKRWALLDVPEVEFVFLGDFTAAEQESIRRELKAAQVNFAEHFGAVTSDFTVYMSTDLALLNERVALDRPELQRVWFTCGGSVPGRAILMILKDCPDDDRAHGGPLAHEYFHILQRNAGNWSNAAEGSTLWIHEGSAVYASAIHSDIQGRISLTARREGARLAWSASAASSAARAINTVFGPGAIVNVYSVGFLATEWLVERAGPEAVLEFFRLGGHRTAFQRAFGISVSGFLTAFEEHRMEVAPPFEWQIAGTVLGSDGLPIEGTAAWVVVRIEGAAWRAGQDETNTRGVFEFIGPGSGYTIGLFFQCPRADGVEEWVRSGEWGAAGLVADSDGIWDPHDEVAEPFLDGERDRTGMVIRLPETRDSLIAKHCEP